MIIEEFKDIEGFDGKYQISNLGKIYRIINGTRLEHKTRLIEGYPSAGLECPKINGKRVQKIKKVHRLVAEYFIPNPENKPCVNHKDGNKTNNNVTNLEWCTVSENTRHAYREGLEKSQWTKEIAIAVINLIENYNYNFSTVARKLNLGSRNNVMHFYRYNGYKTFNLSIKNVKVFKHCTPKPLPFEYEQYLNNLIKANTELNQDCKKS